MVTHELGSPLAASRGLLAMLATGEFSEVAGVGLGLYLSRHIVQAHGAELCVDATPGLGSVFAFDLEVAR